LLEERGILLFRGTKQGAVALQKEKSKLFHYGEKVYPHAVPGTSRAATKKDETIGVPREKKRSCAGGGKKGRQNSRLQEKKVVPPARSNRKEKGKWKPRRKKKERSLRSPEKTTNKRRYLGLVAEIATDWRGEISNGRCRGRGRMERELCWEKRS